MLAFGKPQEAGRIASADVPMNKSNGRKNRRLRRASTFIYAV